MKDTGAAGRGSLKGPDNLKKPPLFFTLYPIGRLHGICLFGCACFCIFALAQDAGEHEGAKADGGEDDSGRVCEGCGELEAFLGNQDLFTGYG